MKKLSIAEIKQHLDDEFAVWHCSEADIKELSLATGVKFVSLYSDCEAETWISKKDFGDYWQAFKEWVGLPIFNVNQLEKLATGVRV